MSNAALAFFTGLGSGYLEGKDDQERKAREKRREQREDEEYQARRLERQKKQEADAALKQAAQPMVAAAGGMSKPAWMDDRDVGLPENAALANGGLEATATANTPQAVRGRQVAALRGIDPERADRLEQSGKQAELTDLQLTTTKEAADRDRAMRDMVTKFKQGGWAGLPKLYEGYNDGNAVTVQEDGKGGATLTFIGPDGKPAGQQHYASQLDFLTDALARFDPKLYLDQMDKREGRKHQAATLAETSRHNQATERNQAAQVQLAARSADRADAAARRAEEREERGTVAGKLGMLEQALGRKLEGDEREKTIKKIAGLGNDDDGISKFADAIVTAGVKAETIKPEQAGQARAAVIQSVRQANQDAQTEQVVKTELAKASKDPAAYAATYEKALRIPGMTADYLTSLGFKPPAKPKPRPAAAAGMGGREAVGKVN